MRKVKQKTFRYKKSARVWSMLLVLICLLCFIAAPLAAAYLASFLSLLELHPLIVKGVAYSLFILGGALSAAFGMIRLFHFLNMCSKVVVNEEGLYIVAFGDTINIENKDIETSVSGCAKGARFLHIHHGEITFKFDSRLQEFDSLVSFCRSHGVEHSKCEGRGRVTD